MPRATTVRSVTKHAAPVVVLVIGLAVAWSLSHWTMQSEIRSIDRRLDIAGQTLVEELHGELSEAQRDLSGVARTLFNVPPVSGADFAALVLQAAPLAGDAAMVERSPEGLKVRFSTDPAWLEPGVDPSAFGPWAGLRSDVPSVGNVHYLDPLPGYDRIVIWDSIGLPGTGTAGGVVIMAVSMDDLVAATGTSTTGGSPTIEFRELAPHDEITTSEPLIHKEYFVVGERRWRFDVTPAEGTVYAVDGSAATLVGALAAVLALGTAGFTEVLLRRRHAQQQLELSAGLSKDKDRFLLALSHQIRTPLTAVVGFLDVLRSHQDLEPEEREEFLNRAADHAEEVAAIVHDILVVTRDDLDMLVVTAQPTNPVKEALAVASAIPLNDATIDINPPLSDAPMAVGDPVRVRQVVRNLVANAIRHGGSNIHISVHRLGAEVVITVADDGPGLPEEVAARLRRLGPTALTDPDRADSLGLGLRVAWLLAERMAGRIEYRRSGSLTMFELILPAALSNPRTAEQPMSEVGRVREQA